MKTIWKYKIELEHEQDIDLPVGAEFLSLHQQGNRHEDDIYLWCLVDTEADKEKRTFQFFTTGEELPENTKGYVGTLRMINGVYVYHLMEMQKG